MTVAEYVHQLGKGNTLTAYSISPDIGVDGLRESIYRSLLTTKAQEPLDLKTLARDIPRIAVCDSFDDLDIQASFDMYDVPEPLIPHRDAVPLKTNTDIMLLRGGNFQFPMRVIKGKYRHFVATDISREPAKLCPEVYPAGKTIGDLLPEWGLTYKDMARYLALLHLLKPSDGAETSFVYKGPNVHAAPDCMAFSGSTPEFPEQFNWKGFSYNQYLTGCLEKEMKEEYDLNPGEFHIGKMHLMDDQVGIGIPFLAVEICTPFSTRELAQRAYGKEEPRKEHSIFYSTDTPGLASTLEQLAIFPPNARVFDVLVNDAA